MGEGGGAADGRPTSCADSKPSSISSSSSSPSPSPMLDAAASAPSPLAGGDAPAEGPTGQLEAAPGEAADGGHGPAAELEAHGVEDEAPA